MFYHKIVLVEKQGKWVSTSLWVPVCEQEAYLFTKPPDPLAEAV